MASEKQISANRLNTLLSSGPINTQITRFNALKHGMESKMPTIPGEDKEEYRSFCKGIIDDLQPEGHTQRFLVERIVFYLWRLRRAEAAEEAIARKFDLDFRNCVDWEKLMQSGLTEKIDRYTTNAIRQLTKLLGELRSLQEKDIS